MMGEYDKEYIFDIDQYLIDNYPKMTAAVRRTICALSLESLDSMDLENIVDDVISDYAKRKLELGKIVEEDEDDDE